MSIVVYPRLFTTRNDGSDQVVMSSGDQSIEMLYGSFLNHTVNTKGWVFYRDVLLNAVRLFGDLQSWFDDQLANPALTSYNRAFIQDTLSFIKTGQRQMSVLTWCDLMSEVGSAHPNTVVSPRYLEKVRLKSVNQPSLLLLQQWAGHPNGMEDLVNSLHLLFGKSRDS